MDDFRKQQKAQCGQAKGIFRGYKPYGCDCCNQGCLRHRKVTQRRLAKSRLKAVNRKQLREET